MRRVTYVVGVVALFSALLMIPASATTWYVDDDGGADFSTIQAAVNAANEGDTIIVRDGRYSENIAVDHRLSIKSENGSDFALIQAPHSNGHVFTVTADYVTISGFTVQGATNSSGIYLGTGIGHCTIIDNKAMDNRNGICLYQSNSNTISSNTANANSDCGICLVLSSNDNTIVNNTANSNYNDGISLHSSSSNTIANNTANANNRGIYLDSSSNNTLSGNTMWEDGIAIWGSSVSYFNSHEIDTANTVNGKPIYYWKDTTGGTVPAGAGQVILVNSTGVTISGQNVSDGSIGIILAHSSGCTIANNTANSNNRYGIYLASSCNNTVARNTALSNDDGISLWFSSNNNTIACNTVNSNNGHGIYLDDSSSNTIVNNTANSNNRYGIYLYHTSNNTLSGNTLREDGIAIWGNLIAKFDSHEIDTSNTVNGKPVYYWKDTAGGTVPAGAGQVILVNSTGVTISDQNVSDGSVGVVLAYSSGCIIANNTANSNNYYGILFYSSSNNIIAHNTANSNGYYGICLSSSSNNTIYNNHLNNTNNAFDTGTNTWNISKTVGINLINGPYLGGNYWSDYTGEDSDGDGLGDTPYDLGDTPYEFSGNTSKDYLPLVPQCTQRGGKSWIRKLAESIWNQLLEQIGYPCSRIDHALSLQEQPKLFRSPFSSPPYDVEM